MKRTALIISILSLTFLSNAFAAKLASLKVIDKDYLMVYFKDGDVEFVDDGLGSTAFTGDHDTANNYKVLYGTALNTTNAVNTANWTIKCASDSNYGTSGLNPSNCYRKSKLNGMAEMDWSGSDFIYDYTMEHTIYIRLPYPMGQGKTYTIEINANTNSDVLSRGLTFDIFSSRSEAIHTNLVGYLADSSVKAVDLFTWMGDGLARDYSSFVGKKVYIYNVNTAASQQVGTVQFWMASSNNDVGWHNFSMSDVWTADFTGFNTPGTYRIAIEGVGCSEDFDIKNDAYFEPFRLSTLGYFYMRIGQNTNYPGMPVPRRPLYIPGVSPSSTRVYITDMSPVHPDWATFSSGGDVWDKRDEWAAYSTGRQNNNARGGHSDAADWDRHLGHISDIYDMLLPYLLTDGNLPEDNLQIAESGNGIPDILDEAKNEVDFWLNLRDGDGYSHGLNNPNGSNILYQAGNTPIAAWASAANASMLANCFMIAGNDANKDYYTTAAITAYNYASALPDQMLTATVNIGDYDIRGRDLKMMAAAFLYNVTGNTAYEDMLNSLCEITSDTSTVIGSGKYQLWSCAGYLKTTRTVRYPTLFSRMRNSVINEAKNVESNNTASRPSRRAADNAMGYWKTAQNVQRCMVGHAVTTSPTDKSTFENAMVLEADWGLGRNSLNIIYMTTASTNLENKRSIENCYTTGRDDGFPGVHPGHTPYLNTQDWYCGMIMGCPGWMTSKCYPDFGDYQSAGWPKAEAYFNTRYVWAHSEFTPRQTMRGKAALYGYLYALYNNDTEAPSVPTGLSAVPGNHVVTLNWDDNSESDVNGYNVYRATVSGGPYTKQNPLLLSDSNYTDSNVTNGTTYYYVVTAVDMSANESDNSAQVSATPYADTTPPAVPTGLSAAPGQGTVSLNWNDNGEGDLAGYNIYRSTVSGGPYTKQNGPLLTSSAYIDNNVTNGTTYYYVVTAVDASTNQSGYSSQVSATPVNLPPAAPTGLSAIAGNGTVSLNWNNNGESDLAGYNIYRSITSDSGYVKRNGSLLTSSDYVDNTVTNGTTYYYVVTAVDTGSIESAYSSQVSATPSPTAGQDPYPGPNPHPIPGRIESENYDSGGEGFAYHDTTSSNSGNQYRTDNVDVETCGEGGYNIGWIEPGEWLEYVVNVASPGTYNVELRVASQSSGGTMHIEFGGVNVTGTVSIPSTGGWQTWTSVFVSDVVLSAGPQIMRISMDSSGWNFNWVELTSTVDIPPAAPTGLSASASDGMVTLNWNDNTEGDLDGYNVYRSTTQGSGYVKQNGSLLSASNYTDNSVTNGTTYYYVVTAADTGTNESVYSGEVSATPQLITDIEILGSWVQGTSHPKEIGTNRALIFVEHAEHGQTILNSVIYGGQAMTKVVDINVGTGTRAHVAAFVLNETGIAAATNNDFVVNWSATPGTVGYSSVFLGNVDQMNIVGPNDSNATTTLDPITTDPLSTSDGDMVILAATCGNSGTYTLSSGFTEGIDQQINSTATGVTGHKLATGAQETPSAEYSASINRHVIIGFVVNAMQAPGYSNCSEVLAAGHRLAADIYDTGDCYVDYYDLETFADYWLNDTCTGPDNCHGADFETADGAVNLFDFSNLANQWMTCNDPEDPECPPNW